MNFHPAAQQPSSPRHFRRWRCGLVSVSSAGVEKFMEEDSRVIDWPNTRLLEPLNASGGDAIGLHVHTDKTFIGKVARGFDFLGVQFQYGQRSMSAVSCQRLTQNLAQKISHAAQLYEQGRLRSLKSIELYLTHWLRRAKGLGIATLTALDAILRSLAPLCQMSTHVTIPTFSKVLMKTFLNK